jgi:hypothetical protein
VISADLEALCATTENRGVPGSSPGSPVGKVLHLREQLDRYLGRLDMAEREAIVDIYRGLLGHDERTPQAPRDCRWRARTTREARRARRARMSFVRFSRRPIGCSGRSRRVMSPR